MKNRLRKKLPEERVYYDKMLSMFGVGNTQMSFVTKRSVQNQFYSELVTPLEDSVSAPSTTVHIFYAVKMGPQYLERYERHFKYPAPRDIRTISWGTG